MADKFVVQYIIKARDAFSKDADKVTKSLLKLVAAAKKANINLGQLTKTNTKAIRKTGQLSDRMIDAGRDAEKMGRKYSKAANKSRKSSDFFRGSLDAIKRAAIGAAAALGSVIFVGAKFQSSINDLSAITGATGKDLAILEKGTLSLAKASVSSQADVANGIKLIASAKPELLKNIPALLATTKSVLLLKNAGVDLEVASMAVAGGLNTFGKDASQANKFVNILAAGSKLGSSSIMKTAEAVKIAGPGADAAGLSFLQLNAAIQTVAKGSIFGSQAGTALGAIFGRLRRQGHDFKKVGLQQVFENIRKELEAIKNPQLRALREAKIFGEEHSKVGLAVLKNVKLLGKFERELKNTNVAQEQADARMRGFAFTMRKMRVTINDILIKAFMRLEPVLTSAVNDMSLFFESMTNDQIKSLGDDLTTLIEVTRTLGVAAIETGRAFRTIGTFVGETAAGMVLNHSQEQFKANSQAVQKSGFLSSLFGVDKTASPELAPMARKQLGDNTPIPLRAPPIVGTHNQTNVDVNVALDKGLKQTGKASVTSRTKRMDTGEDSSRFNNIRFGGAL